MKHDVWFTRPHQLGYHDDSTVHAVALERTIELAESMRGYSETEAEEEAKKNAETNWVLRYGGQVDSVLSLVYEIQRLRSIIDGDNPIVERIARVWKVEDYGGSERVTIRHEGFKTKFTAPKGTWHVNDRVRVRLQAKPEE